MEYNFDFDDDGILVVLLRIVVLGVVVVKEGAVNIAWTTTIAEEET